MVALEPLDQLTNPLARRHRKGPHMIDSVGLTRSHIVDQGPEFRLPPSLPLLPEHRETDQFVDTLTVTIQHDILTVRDRRPEAIHRPGLQQPAANDLIEQLAGVGEQLASLLALLLIVEDPRVLATHLPRRKKR